MEAAVGFSIMAMGLGIMVYGLSGGRAAGRTGCVLCHSSLRTAGSMSYPNSGMAGKVVIMVSKRRRTDGAL